MKKIIIWTCLFLVMLSQSTNIMSQAKMTEPEATDCYKGISFSWSNILHNKETGEYLYYIKFINNYSTNVKFRYRIKVAKFAYPSATGFNYTTVIEPGKSFSEGMIAIKSAEDISEVEIGNVCFGDMKNCKENCYATCDVIAGRPNQPCEKLPIPKEEEKKNTIQETNTDINGEYQDYPGALPVKITVIDGGIKMEWGRTEAGKQQIVFQKTSPDTYVYDDKASNSQQIIKFNGNKEFTYTFIWNNSTDKPKKYKRISK